MLLVGIRNLIARTYLAVSTPLSSNVKARQLGIRSVEVRSVQA